MVSRAPLFPQQFLTSPNIQSLRLTSNISCKTRLCVCAGRRVGGSDVLELRVMKLLDLGQTSGCVDPLTA